MGKPAAFDHRRDVDVHDRSWRTPSAPRRLTLASAGVVTLVALALAAPATAEEHTIRTRLSVTGHAVVDLTSLLEGAPQARELGSPETVPFMPVPKDLPVPFAARAPQAELELEPEPGPPPPPFPPSPPPLASFPALGDNNTTIPPDTMGAVGPGHLMVTLNSQVRIQDRAGGTISTTTLDTFWAGLPGSPDAFDPKLLYDEFNDRWIFTAGANKTSASSAVLIAVSATSNPTGIWYQYLIDADATDILWADYPSLGFNKDWIVVQINMFPISSGTFASHIYVLGKADLYANDPTPSLTLFTLTGMGGVQAPAVTHDNSLAGEYLLQHWNGNSGGNGFLRIYSITGSVGSESLNTDTVLSLISTPNPWDDGAPGEVDFAPQLGTPRKIQANDDRLQKVIYRNGSLWGVQTVFLPAGGSPTRSAVQWWELTPNTITSPPPTATIVQRARIDDGTGALFFAFPSIDVNQFDDVLIGYSRFSASQFASANYSFRSSGDALNTLQDDTVLKAGEDTYVKDFGSGQNRWGDFSNTQVDPLGDTNFWTIQEYAETSSGSDRWGTWWGQVGFGPTPTPTATATATPRLSCTPPSTPVATPTPITAGGLKCKRGIAKEASKFVAAKTKALQKCENAVVKDQLVGPCPGAVDSKASLAIAKAVSKLHAGIDKACGGDDKSCGGNLTNEEAPFRLGWPATCPNFEGNAAPECSTAITSCADIADCIECVGEAAVDQAIALYYGSLVNTAPGTTVNKCQQAIGKETTKFLTAKDKALQKCWDARLNGKHADTCPNALALAGTPAQKAAAAIAKAESKKITAICKACGGADQACDDTITAPDGLTIAGSGTGDDLTPGQIGFVATCSDVKAPGGGPYCNQQVTTLADLVECVDCVSEFKVDCVDRARVPEFGAYPCECNP